MSRTRTAPVVDSPPARRKKRWLGLVHKYPPTAGAHRVRFRLSVKQRLGISQVAVQSARVSFVSIQAAPSGLEKPLAVSIAVSGETSLRRVHLF